MTRDELSEKILEYLESKYRNTGWPYIHIKELRSYFYRIDILPALNDLRIKGIVRKRENANGILIELVVSE